MGNKYSSYIELNISNKSLTQLPDDIGKYTNLKVLYCWANQITSLDNLPPNLQELDCDCNPLTYDFEPTLANIRNYNTARKQSG